VVCSTSTRSVTSKLIFPSHSNKKPQVHPNRYFTFLTECQTPKACTILLRGPSKDILNEIDRNLADAMSVARNVVFEPTLAPGGGATDMAISVGLHAKARTIVGVEGWPYRAVADAMEVIPRTLVQNSGGNAIRVLTELRVRLFNPVFTYRRLILLPPFLFCRPNTRMVNIRGVLMVIRERSWI
jgi:chaperonin GroEL (HSP60 family)